jgi:anti-sigma regulatory factor (Ser/Thr protein kinase)
MSAATERWPGDAGLPPDAVCDLTPTAHRSLPASPHAPRDARAFLAAVACPQHVSHDSVQTAALLVSELVTNALRHAGPPLSLTVGCARSWLVVEVNDGSLELPAQQSPDELAEGGRGLPLISALATAWGSVVSSSGKVTWLRLHLDH